MGLSDEWAGAAVYQQMKDLKASTEAHIRRMDLDVRSMLEGARQKRQSEDLEQKARIDELYLRTRVAATTIRERAEAEFKIQETVRERYMNETDDMLSKSREELEKVVRKSEDVVSRAEDRLKAIKADAHCELLKKESAKIEMQTIVKEAQTASSDAWAEVNHMRAGLHTECCGPIDDLLRTVAGAHRILSEIRSEQEHLVSTRSRGLELEARSVLRHAVQTNAMRKQLVKWTLNVNKSATRPLSLIPPKTRQLCLRHVAVTFSLVLA